METITLNITCPFCRKHYTIKLPAKEYLDGIKAYNAGAPIQDAFPTFTPSQREAIKTGICDDCWNNM